MKATADLKNDHESILLMLKIMMKISSLTKSEGIVDPVLIEKIIDFLKTFADKSHHGKEEDFLFPVMIKAGIPNEGGPIGMMLSDHTEGRGYIAGIASSLAQYKIKPDTASLNGIALNMENYAELLSQHIDKENQILFMIADSVLTEKQQDLLYEEFEKVEEERIGEEKFIEYHEFLQELKQRYL
jgi:hemerythrin-like domain-containing protein